MTKRASWLERIIQRIDDRIEALQWARHEILAEHAARKPLAVGKKRAAVATPEGYPTSTT